MRLGARQPDGHTLRAHLQAAARSTGHIDPMLTKTRVPPSCSLLWQAYVELDGSRPIGLGGAGSIPQSEVLAWQVNNGVRLNPWEMSTLAAMDRAALDVAAEEAAKKRKPS